MKKNKFAVIILNWNGLKDTIECIDSILNTQSDFIEIFCLDNGSKKREDLILAERYSSKISIFRSKKNLGFAEGNNFVCSKIHLHKFDYVFLLNNDTIIKSNFFEEMNFAIGNNKDPSVNVFVPTIFYWNIKLKENRIWRADDFRQINGDKIVKHPTGCAVIIKTQLIKDYGLFNKNFFAYGEEVEYFYRLRKLHQKILYVSNAIIWHKVIESKDSLFKIYMISRNKLYYLSLRKLLDKSLYFIYLFFFYNLKKFFIYCWNLDNLKTFIHGNLDGLYWIFTGIKPQNPFLKNE